MSARDGSSHEGRRRRRQGPSGHRHKQDGVDSRSSAPTESPFAQWKPPGDGFPRSVSPFRNVYWKELAARLQQRYYHLQQRYRGRFKNGHIKAIHAGGAWAQPPPLSTELSWLLKNIGTSSRKQAHNLSGGILVFGGLLFLCGAAPWCLPWLFILFFAICMPWRAVEFVRNKWTFYLVDFCYWANCATIFFLIRRPNDLRLQALTYAMGDGPLAGAMVVWRSPWVFSSSSHVISVLMHLMPGLAVFAHRYFTPPVEFLKIVAPLGLALGNDPQGRPHIDRTVSAGLAWLYGAPVLFYCVWQFVYWLIVQVIFRQYILSHGQETSYIALARRAARADNFWNRLVRRGSITRRLTLYGLIQLAFTVVTLLVALPTYYSFPLAVVWQGLKFLFPVHYGSLYTLEKTPRHALLDAINRRAALVQDPSVQPSSKAPVQQK